MIKNYVRFSMTARPEMRTKLDAMARKCGVHRTQIIRAILQLYIDGERPKIEEIVL